MKKPVLTAKNIIAAAAVAGALASLWRYAQTVTGWLALPTVEAAQARGLDSLRAWHKSDQEAHAAQAEATRALAAKVDTISSRQRFLTDVVSGMPAGKAAAKRIREKQREREEREELFGSRRSLAADDRSTFRALKAEAIP